MKKYDKNKQIVGRTMIEIIAVLSIVGTLTIVGLLGFQQALVKHKANETMYGVVLRGKTVPELDADFIETNNNKREEDADFEWLFPKLKNDGREGHYYQFRTVPADKTHKTDYNYMVRVLDVDQKVCRRILSFGKLRSVDAFFVENESGSFEEFIDGEDNLEAYCTKATQEMRFYFTGLSRQTETE